MQYIIACFRLIKPLVGHNCSSDLLLIYHQFYKKLPGLKYYLLNFPLDFNYIHKI